MRFYILLFLIVAGCTQTRGGGDTKFLLPWRDNDGKYSLREVTIETLASPYELRGEAAEVYFQSAFSDHGFEGQIARPHLTKSGDVYIPQDSESAMAVAVYAQFDSLFRYEQKQHTAFQIAWPRKVGLELNMTSPEGTAHNNAHYFTALDIIGLLPYTSDGVPVALNHGIVAHEHFHAHFQREVINALHLPIGQVVSNFESLFYPLFNLVPRKTPADVPDVSSPRSMNNFVMRAWNEGLADLFAGIYTGQADFFTASLPQLASARQLDADIGPLWKGKDLARVFAQSKTTVDQMLGLAYGQGTVMARLLYRLAYSGVESPDAFSKRILLRLPMIPLQVRNSYDTSVMDLEQIISILLDGYPVNSFVCANLQVILSKPLMDRSFAKCAGF